MPIRTSRKQAAELLLERLRKAQEADDAQAVDALKEQLHNLGVNPDSQPSSQSSQSSQSDLPAAPEDAHYTGLVQQGQAAMAQGADAMWQLGRLASQVQTNYGQKALQRYADDIRCNYQTLRRCRVTYAAWMGKQSEPHGSLPAVLPFAVCRALTPLPHRAQLLAADPNMKERTALEHARAWRADPGPPPCPLHQLYALLRQQKLFELVDATIVNKEEEYGPLRLQAANHIAFVIGELQRLELVLREPTPTPTTTITLLPAPPEPPAPEPQPKRKRK